jgi:acyl-CoA dehydrogenase
MLNEWQFSQHDLLIPPSIWDYIKQEGFFGLIIEPHYGGKGFSAFAHSCIVTKIASRSPSVAVTVMVPNSLGPAELLQMYGTETQKNYYLSRLATGEEIPCFALTGLESGSDAASMLDHGIVCHGEHEGQKVLGMRVSWNKRYITLAPVASLLGLAIQLYDPDHLLGKKEHIGITLCLIPTTHPGVQIGKRHIPMNLAFQNGPTSGKDVFIPLDWVIGGAARIGDGWKMLMECLAIGRGISLPSLSTAAMLLCYRTTGAYARIRQQFSLPIGRFEGIEEPLARIAGLTYLCEATRCFNAHLVDQGLKPAIAAAIAKYHVTEMSRQVINDAMDIHGGRAVQLGSRNYLAIAYQAVPIGITVEGANILTRNLMIFGQGAIRCHPYVQQHITALNLLDQQQGMKQFDKSLLAHLGYSLSNATRCLWQSITAGHFIIVRHRSPAKKYCRQLTRMSTALAWIADVAMLMLGGDLKRKERLSARLGDVLSYLYLASASLVYFEQQGQAKEDWSTVEWGLRHCLYHAQQAFIAFFDNFPNRWMARTLRRWVFFWGTCYRTETCDTLDHHIASHMMQPSEFRNRLTQYCYTNDRVTDPLGRMENALQKILEVAAIEVRLKKAVHEHQLKRSFDPETLWDEARQKDILSESEHQQLQQARAAILDAIAVDEF